MGGALAARLELLHDGNHVALAVTEAVLGRTAASELQVVHPLVSRRHCRFEVTANGVFAEDLGSSNGTYVNDVRIEARVRLTAGDVVRVGLDGPQFRLVAASFEGRDVTGADPDVEADAKTMLAGDPGAAAVAAQVAVAPHAAAGGDTDELPSMIPVAEPLDAGGDTGQLPRTDFYDASALMAAGAGARNDPAKFPRLADFRGTASSRVGPFASQAALVRFVVGLAIGFVAGLLLVVLLAVFTSRGSAAERTAPAPREAR